MSDLFRINNVKEKVLLFVLAVFFLYSFWYQYAYRPIDSALIVLAILMAVLALPRVFCCSEYSEISGFLLFFAYCVISSILLGSARSVSIDLVVSQVQYLIPLFAIYTYASQKWRNYLWINRLLVFTCVVLSVSLRVRGIQTNTGATVIGELNANVIASLLTIGTLSTLILLCFEKNRIMKILILLSTIIILSAMLDVGSRRGIVVLLFLVISAIVVFINEKYRGKYGIKIVIIFSAVLMVLSILINIEVLWGDTVAIQRLLAGTNTGDIERVRIQSIAWDIFSESPLYGKGLGIVSVRAGMYAHSIYYELLAGTGVVGGLLILFYFAKKIFELFQCHKSIASVEKGNRNLSMILCIGIISILLTGMYVVLIYDMYFYIWVAVIASGIKLIKRSCI